MTVRSVCVVLFVVMATLSAAAWPEAEAKEQYTLANLVAVSHLRCDALGRGKAATRQADIFRTEAYHSGGAAKIRAEEKMVEAEAVAGAAFEEAGRLKRRLARMVDAYLSARRLEWYQTVDFGEKIRLEDLILAAKEVLNQACS
jgi:hypothetical protein